MQALLADRFKLMVHRETRQAPIFALVLTKPGQTGAELVPHPPSDTCAVEPTVEADDSMSNEPARRSALGELPRVCGVIAHLPTNATGHIRFGGRGVMLSLLASSLPTMTGMAMWLWFAMMNEGHGQSLPGAKLEFDVASVRQNKSDDRPSSTFSLDNGNVYSTVNKGDGFTPRGSYFAARNQPLWHYIAFAYNLSGTQELALRFNYFAGLRPRLPLG